MKRILSCILYIIKEGAIAQLVERFHGMEEVRGSIPLSSTEIIKKIFQNYSLEVEEMEDVIMVDLEKFIGKN